MYHPELARAFGSVNAGLLASCLLTWWRQQRPPNGWLCVTRETLYGATALTRCELETARRVLRSAGVLQERLAGIPAKRSYRLDEQALLARCPNAVPAVEGDLAPQRDEETERDDVAHASRVAAWPEHAMRPPVPQSIARTTHRVQTRTAANVAAPPPANSNERLTTIHAHDPSNARVFEGSQKRTFLDQDSRASIGAAQGKGDDDVDRAMLVDYLSDFGAEFRDAATLRASVTRATRLLHASGLSREDFIGHLYAARCITKERMASIRATDAATGGVLPPQKRPMPYFFAVLEDRLRRDRQHAVKQADADTPAAPTPAAASPPKAPTRDDLAARWHTALAQLEATMLDDHFQQWIAPLRLEALAGDEARLLAPGQGVADYVQHRLKALVARTLGVARVVVRSPGNELGTHPAATL